jgi:hypothetical protein
MKLIRGKTCKLLALNKSNNQRVWVDVSTLIAYNYFTGLEEINNVELFFFFGTERKIKKTFFFLIQ